ncbi:MAG: DUF3124 domain-containing protein [Bacteroidales bacterium]
MKNYLIISILTLSLLTTCKPTNKNQPNNKKLIHSHELNRAVPQDLHTGTTYLPVYSQIYQLHEEKTYNLTVTVSMRNVSPADTLYLFVADYYNSKGDKLNAYLNQPIALQPLETMDIVIEETDKTGGTGANFLFDWGIANVHHEPVFESVMISTSGQQGLSFLTRGIKVSE